MAVTRIRCAVCHQYPTLTKGGALKNHSYPWYHSQAGTPCPGSGSQVTPLAGQLALDELADETIELAKQYDARRKETPCEDSPSSSS